MLKIFIIAVMLFVSSCSAPTKGVTELPDSSDLPRMPDEYRDKDKRITDPVGMWVYDAAERQAEEDYFGVEVLSLEESQKILREREEALKKESSGTGKERE